MNMMRVNGGMIVYVILICALEIGFSEGRKRLTGTYIGNVACWASPEIDENTVELVWENCRKEILDMEVSFGKNPKAVYFIRRNMHETVSALPPQVKKSLLTCLWKKKLHFGISRNEASSKSLFSDCFEIAHSSSVAPRRYLISKQVAKTHAPAPSSAFAHPKPKSPKPKKPPKQKKTPKPKKPPKPIVLPPSPSKRMHKPRNKKNPEDEKKRIIMIISATILGTCILAALLFCCLKCARNKISPQDGLKDEWPLLNLSSSDYSNGSSSNKDLSGRDFGIHNGRHPSHKSNLSIMADSMDEKTLQENVNASTPLPPLKPPPGRAVPVSAPTPAPLAPDPPPPPPPKHGPRPPPPPKAARPPPAPPMKTAHPPPPPQIRGKNNSSEGNDTNSDPNAPKAKLKPFFWDKVLANPDQSMVWHEVNAGSFQFNEEMMESLFGYNTEKNKNNRKTDASSSLDAFPQYIQIIDTRKAQNLSILLRALNVTTDEVCDALREGTKLPTELVQTLLKMAPTTDEELKLRLFSGDPSQLGPAERFLKVLVEIPFSFKRLESLLFMNSLQEEVSTIKESFATLEVACNKLRNSRLFLKLLEAVLKTGNRMNDGTYRGGAQAFKLDTLLKLSDVKGTDGKTTLLHFVVQEIIRSEGVKAARTTTSGAHETEEHFRDLGLQVVSSVSTELWEIKKAAVIDCDGLTSTVSKLGHALAKTQNFLKFEMQNLNEESGFHSKISSFVEKAEVDVTWLQEEDKRIQALVKNTADYFHGHAGKDEGLRLFVIVRDFLVMLDKECKEVRDASMKKAKMVVKKEDSIALEFSEARHRQTQLSDNMHLRLFPAIRDQRMDSFSSESDDD